MHQDPRAGLPEFASDEPADPVVDPVTSAVFPLSSCIPSPRFWRFIRKIGWVPPPNGGHQLRWASGSGPVGSATSRIVIPPSRQAA